MKRALALAALLRRKISAKTVVARAQKNTGGAAPVSEKLKSAAARRRFDRKPPEPAPSIPRRVFCGAPRLRERS